MLRDELSDDLVEFLQSGRRLNYDAAECEVGLFTLRALNEIEEIQLTVGAENGDSVCVMRGLDLLKTCEDYDPHGMLVYIPSLRKYGSYDAEKKRLVTFRGMSWSQFRADPARYINARWYADAEIAEETFDEKSVDRIVEACSAANAVEASLLCSVLEERGIRAESVGDQLGNAAGDLPLGEAIAPRVWVREGDVGRACEIVQECGNQRYEPATPAILLDFDVEEVVFPCQECGKIIGFPSERRGHVETCPECGKFVDVPDEGGHVPSVEDGGVEDIEREEILDDDET